MENPKLTPNDLTKEELIDIVNKVRDCIWPRVNRPPAFVSFLNIMSILESYNLDI